MSTIEDQGLETFEVNETIGLGDEDRDKLHQRATWYKAEKGRTDRVAIVYFPTILESARRQLLRITPNASIEEQKTKLAKVRFSVAEKLRKSPELLSPADLLDTREVRLKVCQAAYHQDLGFLEIPKELSSSEQAIWRKVGEPRTYVYTLLLVYQGDRDGEVEREHASKGWRVMPWRFSADKYETLRKIDKGLREDQSNIANVDLLLTCTDSVYQKVTITQAGSALYRHNPEFQRNVLEAAAAQRDQMKPFRQISTDELREKLGMPSHALAAIPGSTVEGSDLGDILAEI